LWGEENEKGNDFMRIDVIRWGTYVTFLISTIYFWSNGW
jgi:hypothetical protein